MLNVLHWTIVRRDGNGLPGVKVGDVGMDDDRDEAGGRQQLTWSEGGRRRHGRR